MRACRGPLSVEQARALQQTFVTGLRAAFVACAVLAALGVVTALLRALKRVLQGARELSVTGTLTRQTLKSLGIS
jgi:hypothetical protein